MEYYEYDDLYKYYLNQERLKSIYNGNPSIYEDGRQLEIVTEDIDQINHQIPKFVFGTVVYLKYQDKYLMLKQEKDNRVVDTLVGLGGKVTATINGNSESSEKAQLDRIKSAYYKGILDTEENMKIAASREVMEETSTYSKDEQGNYSHTITKPGINIHPELLEPIGISRIRIINQKQTECWLIRNYKYELTKQEFLFIESNVSKTNREGSLRWLTQEEATSNMSLTDKIILENENPEISVTEIRDNINSHNILRTSMNQNNQQIIVTTIDGNEVYNSENNKKY